MPSPNTIDGLTEAAKQLMKQRGFVFSDFCQLFSNFDHSIACDLFNSILTAVLEQAESEGKPAYSDQVHLVACEEFNLSLVMAGENAMNEQTLCVSEFDMIVVNLSSTDLVVPVYTADIDTNKLFQRPEMLSLPVSQRLEPYSSPGVSCLSGHC